VNYPILKVPNLMKLKLGAFYQRNSQSDYTDLIFLIMQFKNLIQSTYQQLSYEQREAFYLRALADPEVGTAFKTQLKMTWILLDVLFVALLLEFMLSRCLMDQNLLLFEELKS
jgi:hypothetical protein